MKYPIDFLYIYTYMCIYVYMYIYMYMYVSHYVWFNRLNWYNVVPLVLKVWYAYDGTSTIMSSVDDQKPNHHQTFNPHCNDKLCLFKRLTLTFIIFFLCKHDRKLTFKWFTMLSWNQWVILIVSLFKLCYWQDYKESYGALIIQMPCMTLSILS